MTLIAAFWCLGEQAVICADSCESYGEYKTSVTKIGPQVLAKGKYQLAYAGSGLADLVDALGERLEQSFDKGAASGILSIQTHIQKVLTDFYDSPEVKSYPLDPADANSYVSGVICVRVVPLAKVFLYRFSKTIALPVKDFALRGFEAPIYHRIVKRLYQTPMLPLHAQLVGLRVLSEAASTSSYVDDPFTTVFAMTHNMFTHNRSTPTYVRMLTKVQQEMDDLLIYCADTHAVSDSHARKGLRIFNKMIFHLRHEHKRQLDQEFRKGISSRRKPAKLPEPQESES